MSKDGIDKLRENLLSQQERLLQQLADLEEVKDDLDDSEYQESKTETLEQIIDVAASLSKLASGYMTLTDELGSQRQMTRKAISNAFRTPEVIRMFARREPDQLRQRLIERERDFKLGKMAFSHFNREKKELLLALRQLGEKLTEEENAFLVEDQVDNGCYFERVDESTGNTSKVVEWAKQSGNLSNR